MRDDDDRPPLTVEEDVEMPLDVKRRCRFRFPPWDPLGVPLKRSFSIVPPDRAVRVRRKKKPVPDVARERSSESRTAFVVEDDIPIPPPARTTGVYPWDEMKVGSSFFVPGEAWEADKVMRAADKRTQRYGERFSRKRFPGGSRIWRVK